jgi:hypothetical protein
MLLSHLVIALAVCCTFVKHPATWQERYTKAIATLASAEDDVHRFYALSEAAKAAFEVGKLDEAYQFADELLDQASRYRDDWNYGNAIHDGHMVLGRIALRGGDLETAKGELLQAGKTSGSPQLRSFGPNVSLAKDLIERHQVGAVTEYFRLCGAFWDLGQANLRRWTILVKAGEMPDFGSNLYY